MLREWNRKAHVECKVRGDFALLAMREWKNDRYHSSVPAKSLEAHRALR